MQHAVKSKVLAALLSVMIAVTFTPAYMWQTADTANAVTPNKGARVIYASGGTKDCDDLSEALEEAKDGAKIVMYQDYSFGALKNSGDSTYQIKVDNNVTIDMNGYNISYTGSISEIQLEDPAQTINYSSYPGLIYPTEGKELKLILGGGYLDACPCSNMGGSIIIEGISISMSSPFSVDSSDDKVEANMSKIPSAFSTYNDYMASIGGSLYLGKAAFDKAYEVAKSTDEPLVVLNAPKASRTVEEGQAMDVIKTNGTETVGVLTNVPAGVQITNRLDITYNASTVLIVNDHEIDPGETWNTSNTEDKFRVIFDAKGGKFSNGKEYKEIYATKKTTSGWGWETTTGTDTLLIPEHPTKEGYTFDGWYTSEGTLYDFSGTVNNSMTLYAKWLSASEDEVCSVKFDLNGGEYEEYNKVEKEEFFQSAIAFAAKTYYDEEATEAQLKEAKKALAQAKAFAKEAPGYDETVDQQIDDIVEAYYRMQSEDKGNSKKLNARIDVLKQSLGFVDGKTALNGFFYQEVSKGNYAKEPTGSLSKEGYTFGYWTVKGSYEEFDFNTTAIKENVTLEAKWLSESEDDEYSVYFDLKGGEISSGKATEKITLDKALYSGTGPKVGVAIDAAIQGISAATEDLINGLELSKAKAAKLRTLIAELNKGYSSISTDDSITQKTYLQTAESEVLDFLNEGIYSGGWTETVKDGNFAKKPEETPTKEGYTFACWIDKATGKEFDFNKTAIKENVTLEAKWISASEDDVYSIKFDVNGGKYEESSKAEKENQFERAMTNAVGNYYYNVYDNSSQDNGERPSAPTSTDKYALAIAKKLAKEAPGYYEGVEDDIDDIIKTYIAIYNGEYDPKDEEGAGETEPAAEEPTEEAKAELKVKEITDETKAAAKEYLDDEIAELIDTLKFAEGVVSFDGFFYQEVGEGNYVKEPTGKIFKDNAEFAGWIDEETGEVFNFNKTVVDKNITLIAKWNEECTVEVNMNGGSFKNKLVKSAIEDDLESPNLYVLTIPYGKSMFDFIKDRVNRLPEVVHEGASRIESSIATPDIVPVREGYTFGGWYTDEEFKNKITVTDKITNNIKVYAKWISQEDDDEYMLEYDTKGGTYSIEYTKAEKIEIIENVIYEYITGNSPSIEKVTKVIAEIAGIDESEIDVKDKIEDCKAYYNRGEIKLEELESIIAEIVENNIAKKFTKDGIAKVEYDDYFYDFVNKGQHATRPEGTITKDGYTFEGWYVKGTDEEFDYTTTINKDVALYAKWKAVQYEVSFDLNAKEIVNGDADNGGISTQVVKKGDYATEPVTPIYKQKGDEMYEFVGWCIKGTEQMFDFSKYEIKEDVKLIAKWKAVEDCVIFYDITSGSKVPVAVMSPETGRCFTYAEIYGYKLNEAPEVIEVITKDPIAGIKRIGNDSLNYTLSNLGWTMTEQGLYGPTGYKFAGFYNETAYKTDKYDKETEWDFNTEKVSGNMNIYLKYTPVEYKLIFDRGSEYATVKDGAKATNGAFEWLSGEKTYTQTVSFDTETILEPCRYERKGYTFDGWKLYSKKTRTALRTTYSDEALINANVDEEQENVVKTPEDLYLSGQEANYVFVAQWSPIKYTVKYDANGGEGKMLNSVLTYNIREYNKKSEIGSEGEGKIARDTGSETSVNRFYKQGYHFVGWSTEPTGDVVIKGHPIDSDGNHVSKNTAAGEGNRDGEIDASTEEIAPIAEEPELKRKSEDYHPCTIYDGVQTLYATMVNGEETDNTNLSTKNGDVVTLYAQWAPCENYHYTVTVWSELTGFKINSEDDALKAAEDKLEADKIEYSRINVKPFNNGWFFGYVIDKVGTTDTTIEAAVADKYLPPWFDKDEVHSDESIVLAAENYEDACKYEEEASKQMAAANLNIYDKSMAKTWIAPKAKELTYNKTAQKLVTEGMAIAGEFEYAIVTGKELPGEIKWSTEVPKATNAGTYKVAFRVVATDDSHQDDGYNPWTDFRIVTIAPKEIGVDWGKTSFNYDGCNHVPSATATGVIAGDTCNITVNGAQKAMGSYTASTGELSNSNYTLKTQTKDFTITNAVLLAKATPKGSKKLTVSWTGVSGATEYLVYGINCGKTSVYRCKGSYGAAVMSLTTGKIGGKKVKAHKAYKFYVQAYADDQLIATSNIMHVISAKTKGKKYANPKGIASNQGTVVVGENGISGVSATVKLPKKKKSLGTNHCVPYRYVTSDPGIATVDANGTVRGVHSGTCTVYTQAVNGMWCGTTVVVQ